EYCWNLQPAAHTGRGALSARGLRHAAGHTAFGQGVASMINRLWLAWACIMLGAQAHAASVLPNYQQVRQDYRASDVLVLDRQGELLQRLRQYYAGRRGDWIELEKISPAL